MFRSFGEAARAPDILPTLGEKMFFKISILKVCFLSLFSAFQFSLLAQESQPLYKSVPPKAGERCIVCDMPLADNDLTLIVRGRRVPLKRAMVDSFINNQTKYFAELQPKSALFQENLDAPSGAAQGGISLGWFIFGIYILIALIVSGLSGYAAVSKGLPAMPHFFIGFFFSVFGYIYVLTQPAVVKAGEIPAGLVKVPTTHAPVPCKKCGGSNHPSADRCSGCGADLQPSIPSEVDRR